MVTVTRSTVIDAPLESVWAIVRDFNGHDGWHPAVARSELEDGRTTDQIGAVRSFGLGTGERLRERLLSLSDAAHTLRYAIVESEVPLREYVAQIQLKPVTDGERTFWSWQSTFSTPPGRERELAALVGSGVYEAGFEAVRRKVETPSSTAHVVSEPDAGARPSGSIEGSAVCINRHGGADELRLIGVSAPPPGPGEVRIRQSAIGVNYIDVYCRTGYFDLLKPPGALGMEAAGAILDVGHGVRHLKPGQRVAYACPPVGAYASVRTMDAALVVPLPDTIDNETAAAVLLKGMTAEFLLHRVHAVQPGETVLVFAPAGGVGSLLCQWARHLGAIVIGATGSEDKARLARAAGAAHIIMPSAASLAEQVFALTEGRGADVIYDAVGRDSFVHSLAALSICGHLVSYGQASGDIGSHDIGALAARSVTLSRPNFGHYTDSPEKLAEITARLFDALDRRILKVDIGQRFALGEAAAAHRALEAGATHGSTVLLP